MATTSLGSQTAKADCELPFALVGRLQRAEVAFRKSGSRVLVVEDDTETCHAIGEMLALAGIVADLAFDGKHGLMLATLRDYAVIVTDLRMPELDGLALARIVQKMTDPPHVIMMTAFPTWHAEDEIRRAGASEVWVKPLDLSALVTRILRLIRSKSAVAPSELDTPA